MCCTFGCQYVKVQDKTTKSVYVLAESRLSELYDVDAKVRTAAMFENVRALPVA